MFKSERHRCSGTYCRWGIRRSRRAASSNTPAPCSLSSKARERERAPRGCVGESAGAFARVLRAQTRDGARGRALCAGRDCPSFFRPRSRECERRRFRGGGVEWERSLSRRRKKRRVYSPAGESARLFPWNWSAWLDLAELSVQRRGLHSSSHVSFQVFPSSRPVLFFFSSFKRDSRRSVGRSTSKGSPFHLLVSVSPTDLGHPRM